MVEKIIFIIKIKLIKIKLVKVHNHSFPIQSISCLARFCSSARSCSLKSTWIVDCSSTGLKATLILHSLPKAAYSSSTVPSFSPSLAPTALLRSFSSLVKVLRFNGFVSHIDTSCSHTFCLHYKDTFSVSFAFLMRKMTFLHSILCSLSFWLLRRFVALLWADLSKRKENLESSLLQECLKRPHRITLFSHILYL